MAFYGNVYSQNTWTQKANYGGGARYLATGFSIGNKGYLGTGINASTSTQDFWEWNQLTNTWSQKANFPGQPRSYAVGFSIGTKGYIGTGIGATFLQDFYEYDQTTNTWTQKASFPGAAREAAIGFSIGTKGYIGTGFGNNVYYRDFWEWNQATNTWTQKAMLPGAARYLAVGFSIGTNGYIGTGYGTPANGLLQDFWEWNQSTNTWVQKANYGGGQRYIAFGFAIGSKGYIGEGYGNSGYTQDFWEWDPSANIWVQRANVGGGPRCYAYGYSIGNKGYVATGATNNGVVQDYWEYGPISPLPIELISFNAILKDNETFLIWKTASEINNDYFTIERSDDNKNFISIGELKGAGNSTTTLSYSFIDKNVPSGISYYRLKQTDFDGNFTYSNTSIVKSDVKFELTVFPNPAKDRIFVSSEIKHGNLVIFNSSGKVVLMKKSDEFQGMEIPLENFHAGIYYLNVNNESETYSQRFVIE